MACLGSRRRSRCNSSAINEQWLSFPLSQEIEGRKQKAVLTYKSQLKRLELGGLMRTFIRKNEMLAPARN
jgi:hypothetical protein